MIRQNFKGLVVVHNEQVYWMANERSSQGKCLLQLPLDDVLEDAAVTVQFPKWSKANHKILCVVPDHWFGSETFPFQSKKAGLIEPFLERKLKAAHPGLEQVHRFFNYRHLTGPNDQDQLIVNFLQDERGYRLYQVLHQLHLSPLQFTAPAFLWERMLGRITPDFDAKGVLLVHIGAQESPLYFYSHGAYLFSRNILLPDAAQGLDSLGFEINQSLHMYSQTTKRELDQVYWLSDQPISIQALSEKLSYEMEDIRPLMTQAPQGLAIEQIPLLSGLLQANEMHTHAPFFSVFHRQVKRLLDWKPVQIAAACIGLLLLVALSYENFFLHQAQQDAIDQHRLQHQEISRSGKLTLPEYNQMLDRAIAAHEKPAYAAITMRLLACLPPSIWLNQLDLTLDQQPKMKVTAIAETEDTHHLSELLVRLVDQVKRHFKTAQSFSMEDIDIRTTSSDSAEDAGRYRLSFQLRLS